MRSPEQSVMVCFPVFFTNAAPITAHVTAQAMNQARVIYPDKRAGCRDDLPQGKQWWCVVHGNLPKMKVNESRIKKIDSSRSDSPHSAPGDGGGENALALTGKGWEWVGQVAGNKRDCGFPRYRLSPHKVPSLQRRGLCWGDGCGKRLDRAGGKGNSSDLRQDHRP